MEKSLQSTAINYGIYLGLALCTVTILAYVVNLAWLSSVWIGVGLFLVIIIFGILSTLKTKKLLHGFISFKDAFSSYFITVAIGVILSAIVSIILFNYIDTDAAEFLKQEVIDKSTKMMENFGAPQEQIDEAIAQIQKENQFDLLNQVKSLAFQLIFYCVIGLLVALVLKKTDPEAN